MSLASDLTPQEKGYDGPPPAPVLCTGPPLGDGRWALPQQYSFAGVMNWINHVHPYTFDEAMLHSRENADRMRADPVIEACLRVRMMAVALLTKHIEPDDDNDQDQVAAAAEVDRVVTALPYQLDMKRSLLDAEFVGRSGYHNRWRWAFPRGKQWLLPFGRGKHVDGDKLVFHWDGSVGIRVHSAFPGPTKMTDQGMAYMLTPEEREQFIIHQWEPTDAPFYRPQMSGSINGTGLRGKLYWLWALKSRIWSLSIDFLEWFAQGLTAYYFESGNLAHMQEMQSWIENQQGKRVLLIPRMKDGGPGYKPMERFEPGTASSQFLQSLVTGYFDDLIIRLILGQTLTTQTAPTGLGSGVASAHTQTFDQIVKYSATALDETVSEDYIRIIYKYKYPGMRPGRQISDLDSPNVQSMIENAMQLYQMGSNIPEEPLLEAAGIPQAGPNDTILSNVQPMQPAAVDGQPEGVPVVDGQDPSQGPQRLSRLQMKQITEAVSRIVRNRR